MNLSKKRIKLLESLKVLQGHFETVQDVLKEVSDFIESEDLKDAANLFDQIGRLEEKIEKVKEKLVERPRLLYDETYTPTP